METAERIRLIRIIEKATSNPGYAKRLGMLTDTKRNTGNRNTAGSSEIKRGESYGIF